MVGSLVVEFIMLQAGQLHDSAGRVDRSVLQKI